MTAPFSSRAQLSAIGYAPRPSFFSIPEKYMLAMRTRSAREWRSAAGTVSVHVARGRPIASRLFAAASLRITSVSTSSMRRRTTFRRTTRIAGTSASRTVPISTAWPRSTSAS